MTGKPGVVTRWTRENEAVLGSLGPSNVLLVLGEFITVSPFTENWLLDARRGLLGVPGLVRFRDPDSGAFLTSAPAVV